jgi:hypothetical protein
VTAIKSSHSNVLPAIVSASADLNSEVKSEAVPYALIPGFANRSPNRCKRMIRTYIESSFNQARPGGFTQT